jgi:hypothetical protein
MEGERGHLKGGGDVDRRGEGYGGVGFCTQGGDNWKGVETDGMGDAFIVEII